MSDILIYERIGNIIHAKINAETIFSDEQITTIQKKVYELIDKYKKIQLLLDLTNVQDIGSPFLPLLLNIKLKIAETDGKFKLTNLQMRLSELIELTQLDKSLDIYSTLEKALISFSLDIFNNTKTD